MHRLCVALCKKHYGKVFLITDLDGWKMFRGIPFDEVIVLPELSEIPKEYGCTWSLGKLVAYRHLASCKIHFLHLDYDVFLFKRLPEFIESAGVFAQNFENRAFDFYNIAAMKDSVEAEPDFSRGISPRRGYNMGIFGGRDFDFIYRYSSGGINSVLNPADRAFWAPKKFDKIKAMQNATTAEQWFISAILSREGKKIKLLFDRVDRQNCPSEECARKYGYTHLWGLKDSPDVKKYVRRQARLLTGGLADTPLCLSR